MRLDRVDQRPDGGIAHDLADAADARRDHRRPARHALEQDVRPPFARREQRERVGRRVGDAQPLVRKREDQLDAARGADPFRLRLQTARPFAAADDLHVDVVRQERERGDQVVVPLPLDQVADREHDPPVAAPAQLRARLGRRHRREGGEVDAVAQRDERQAGRREARELDPQRLRDRDPGARAAQRPLHPAARDHVARDQVHVGAARRDDQREAQPPRDEARRHRVGIEVVRVDEVEALAGAHEVADAIPAGPRQRERRDAHAHLRQQRVARMEDAHAVARLALRHVGERGEPSARERARDPGHRRDDDRLARLAAARRARLLRAGEPVAQTLPHEDAVVRRAGIREERREDQQPHRHAPSQRFSNAESTSME